MRTRSWLVGFLALGLWLAPTGAWAEDPEEQDQGDRSGGPDGDEDEASDDSGSTASKDGTSQAPPKVLLDNARAPAVDKRLDPKLAEARKKRAEEREEKAKEDDEGGDDDEEDKGLAGGDEPMVGGGDGYWSTKGATDRKEIDRAPRDTLVNIDFVDAELKDVVKYFAELTGRNFILADKLSGKITIISPTPVTVAEAYEAFLSALDAAGYSTVTEGKVTRIVPNSSSMKEPIRTYTGDYMPYTANMVTRILRLENVQADDISKIASKMVGNGGDVTSYAPTNSLIITDSANNIRRIEELLRELDVSAPKTKLEVIQIEWADATEIVEKIKTVFGVDETAAAPAAQSTPKSRRESRRSRRSKAQETAKAANATSDAVGSETYIEKILADERTNSVIIMATEQAMEDVKEFIARLDYEVDVQGDIHVVYLEHAKAEELAQVLSNLTQEANQRAQQTQRTGGRASRAAASAGGDAKAGGGGSSVAQFEGGVKVTADPNTNSLVVTASRDDFYRLKRVIDMLDIRRKQVFVEAVIMEISDNMERDTGVSFHSGYGKEELGQSGLGLGGIGSVGGSTLMSALNPTSGLAFDVSGMALGVFGSSIPIPFPGSETGTLEIPAFGVVITALQTDTNTEVLSAPNLLTLDNEEAEIIVGQTIPFSAGFTTTTQGMPIANFSREDVALTLRVTPQISEGDTVQLQVFQEITEVVPESQGSDLLSSGGVSTTKRSVETVVSVENNQTIVLGGLMQTNETLSEDKVPLLGDIPLLGALFRSKKKTDKKTNLLLFLTPHVIDGPEDLQEVYTIKFLQKQEFMRRFYGKSLEEQQAEINELLMYSMNLPDTPSVYRERESEPRPDDSADYYEKNGPPRAGASDEPVFRPADEEDYLPEDDEDDEDYEDGYEDGREDGYEDGREDGYEDAEDDFEDDEEDISVEDEDDAGNPAAGTPGDEVRLPYPRPGEILITPGGGEIRYQTTPEIPVEEVD